jgi:FKBP-type peptidyl-prolyl cis-trans isomerase SlyD
MTDVLIADDRVVVLRYRLTDEAGTEIDSSESSEAITYVHGRNQILPGLEKELEGRRAGDDVLIVVSPEGGFGPHHDELVVEVSRSQFDFDVAVGSVVQASVPGGEDRYLQVIGVADDAVTLDANHPLAGKTLSFEVNVESIRDATPEELASIDSPAAEA